MHLDNQANRFWNRTPKALATLIIVAATISFGISITISSAEEGYVLDGFGGVHAMGGASALSPATTYFGFDVARAIRMTTDGKGYYVLDGFGGLHAGGTATAISPAPPYFGFDVARDMSLVRPPFEMIASAPNLLNTNGSGTVFRQVFASLAGAALKNVELLFPIDCLVQNYQVVADRAMVGTESFTVNIMDDGVSVVSCTVSSPDSGCSSSGTPTVAAGSKVGVQIDFSNFDTTTNGNVLYNLAFTCN